MQNVSEHDIRSEIAWPEEPSMANLDLHDVSGPSNSGLMSILGVHEQYDGTSLVYSREEYSIYRKFLNMSIEVRAP